MRAVSPVTSLSLVDKGKSHQAGRLGALIKMKEVSGGIPAPI